MHDQFRPALMLIPARPGSCRSRWHGHRLRKPRGIGVASVGGILAAGLFTLTVLPASFLTRGERPQGR